jgi:RNA polymerase sigma-70 factor (ECF subfamily)
MSSYLRREVATTISPTGAPATDDEIFQQSRADLFGLAYRMLASAADAEDVVHDAYLRWRAKPRQDVRSPRAFLATVVARLCIDALGSARARRESYVGPWLPEPLLVDEPGPAELSELSDSLSMAFLVLLEELTPAERAALLLHDVFGYGYDELSSALQCEQAACRQLVARARKALGARRRRFEADGDRAHQLATRFVDACAGGDLGGLLEILAEDVVVWTDGGGKAKASPHPVVGAQRAARFLIAIARGTPSGTEVLHANLNGQPGLLAVSGGVAVSAVVLDIAESRVCGVRVVANPDKLAALNTELARRRAATSTTTRKEHATWQGPDQ